MRDHSHEALLIMLFIYFFKFYCPATGAGVVGSCPKRINLCGQIELATCNQSGKDGVFAEEKVVQNCGPILFFSQKTLSSQRYQCHCMHGFAFRAKLSLGWGRFYQQME